jgi:glycine cleavage system aminomethyltransferase T
MGACPIIDPETGETIIDSEGRRSYTTSFEYAPTVGKNIALAFLPHEYCQEGRMLETDSMEEKYPMKVAAVGYGALYDPENIKPRS